MIGNSTLLAEDFLSIFFDYAIDNAYLLSKHKCRTYGTWPKDLLAFCLELVYQLLEQVGSQKGVRPGAGKQSVDTVRENERVCYLVRVSDVGLKRGRCRQCQ